MSSADPPLRIGVVGCGLIAQRSHLPAFAAMDGAIIAALASGRIENATRASGEFGGRVHERWEDLVADDDVDAVSICTTNVLHAPIAIAAAKAGKHVLVEKPMTTSAADADAMIAAARHAGVTLMVAHNLRYAGPFAAIRRVAASGEIGEVVSVRGVFCHAGPDESWGASSDWFWDSSQSGGGALMDLGVHIVDLVLWTVGRRAVEVTAMTSRYRKPTDAEDNAILVVRFEGGALASIQTSWTARPSGDRQLMVQCANGQVALGGSRDEPVAVTTASGRTVPPIPSPDDLGSVFSDFVAAVRTKTPPPVSGQEGRAAVEVAEAAYRSAREGRTIPLPLPR